MDARELRRWLEFYRDLGIRELYAGSGFTTLAGPPATPDETTTSGEALQSRESGSTCLLYTSPSPRDS